MFHRFVAFWSSKKVHEVVQEKESTVIAIISRVFCALSSSLNNTLGVLLVDNKIIGVEQHKKDTWTNSIIQIVSSIISLIASIGVIWIMFRSFKGMSPPFHRSLLWLSVADICSSFAFKPLPSLTSLVIWYGMPRVRKKHVRLFSRVGRCTTL